MAFAPAVAYLYLLALGHINDAFSFIFKEFTWARSMVIVDTYNFMQPNEQTSIYVLFYIPYIQPLTMTHFDSQNECKIWFFSLHWCPPSLRATAPITKDLLLWGFVLTPSSSKPRMCDNNLNVVTWKNPGNVICWRVKEDSAAYDYVTCLADVNQLMSLIGHVAKARFKTCASCSEVQPICTGS